MLPKCILLKDLILNNLHKQRKSGKFCDIRLFVGKKYVWVHSAIICSISAFMKNEFFNSPSHPKRKQNKNPCHSSVTVKLNVNANVDCFECLVKLLDFIYGREIIYEKHHISHIYHYCKILNLPDSIVNIIHDNEKIFGEAAKIESDHLKKTFLDCKTTASDDELFVDLPIVTDKYQSANGDLENPHYNKPPLLVEKSSAEISSVDEKYSLFAYDNPTKHLPFSDGYDRNTNINQSMDDTNTDVESLICEVDEPEMDQKKTLQKPNYNNVQVNLPTGKTQNCIACDFKSNKSVDLLEHLRQTGHGGNVCSLCWTELDNSEELKKHFTLHENPKPFFCGYCDLRFQSRSLLGQHLPKHMFAKPYSCPHCQKAFKRKHGLNCHLITHSPEKKHLCDQCGFSTTHARILRAHKLIHSGNLFKCTFSGCTHTSTRKENMKQHFSTHSNEKPFICELCGLKFTQGKSLKRHSLIHNKGELNNICPHCPFKARRIDNLKAHILRQHSDKRYKRDHCEPITVEPDVKDIIQTPDNLFKKRRRKFPL